MATSSTAPVLLDVDSDEGEVGVTVLDDIFLSHGFQEVATLASKGQAAPIFQSLRSSEQEQRLVSRIQEENEKGGGSDDELEALSDEGDQAVLESFRKLRIAELKQAAKEKDGAGICASNGGGMVEIDIQDFEKEVIEPSDQHAVVMLIYRRGDSSSSLLETCLDEVSRKFRGVKFVKTVASDRIRGFSESDAPTTMAYKNRVKIMQLPGLAAFCGSRTNAQVVEFELSSWGVLKTDLESDPRLTDPSLRATTSIFRKQDVKQSLSDDIDDDDW